MLNLKVVSSLEKIFLGDRISSFDSVERLKVAAGERVTFQILVETLQNAERNLTADVKIAVCDAFSSFTTVDEVGYVPSDMPAYLERSDEDYITKKAGLFPDVLLPIKNQEFTTKRYDLTTLFVTVDLPEDIAAGEYEWQMTMIDNRDHSEVSVSAVMEVYPVRISKNDLLFTQWFHCDSIAEYYDVSMMSEEHWELIEAFIKTAARTGINMLLTPLFTPPLDTAIGGERSTMQLVSVNLINGVYTFDFSLFDRWVDLCDKYKIRYFELSHLYTQWGAVNCPKIVVNVDGEEKKLFGWHTDAHGAEYKTFLSEFLPSLTNHLREIGIAERCYFHISDEPSFKREYDFGNYKKAKEFLTPYLKGFKMIDALSNIEFYEKGLIEIPVCATNHIEPFMEKDIKERWCYYCCSQGELVGNRFFAMPSYRNRILGVQMYVADIVGFLQWGYNFYYSAQSVYKIDPYRVSDGDQAWPSGDPYSVYPYEKGAVESIRTKVFYDALQDRMLLKQLQDKIGRKKTIALIESVAGQTIDFKNYPRNKDFLIRLHDEILDALV